MIDELKLLIEAVAGLPTLTVWVLVGFLTYKLAVIGSIYGLIRFTVEKVHHFMTHEQVVREEYSIGGFAVNKDVAMSITGQLVRLIKSGSFQYVHQSDVVRLARAIDLLEAEEAKK